MQIFVVIPSGKAIPVDVNLSGNTLRFIKQSLNQKGIDTSDVYFEISTNQGIRKYQEEYDNNVLEHLGVTNEMTITMRSNREQKNQQVNPQPNMQPLDKQQLNMINQQNAQSTNWNNPPPSFQQAQQNQQQFWSIHSNPPTLGNLQQYNTPPQPFNPQQFNNPPTIQFHASTNNPQQHNTPPNQFNPQKQINIQTQSNHSTPPPQFPPQKLFKQYPEEQFPHQEYCPPTQRQSSLQGQYFPQGQSLQHQFNQNVNDHTIQGHQQGQPSQTLQPNYNEQVNPNKVRFQQYMSEQEVENNSLRQIEKKNATIKEQNETNTKLMRELDKLRRESNKEKKKLMDQIDQLKFENQYKDIQQDSTSLENQKVNTAGEQKLEEQIHQITQQNYQQKLEIQQLQLLVSSNNDEKKMIMKLEEQVKAEHEFFQQELAKSVGLKTKIMNLEKDISIKEQSMTNQEQLVKQKKQKIQELEQQLKDLNEDLVDEKTNFQLFKDQVKVMINQNIGNANQPVMTNLVEQTDINLKIHQENRQQREYKRKQEVEQKLIQVQQEKLQMEREQDIIFKRTQQERRVIQVSLQQKFKASHGQMDVCFIVDVTGSMNPYKVQTMNCIQGSIKSIKSATNRDVSWACVAYQDFAELNRKSKYREIDFTTQPEKVEEFLSKIRCEGGDDEAEDVRGGIKQTCNLNWTKKFKIAILICDAPTHGKIYNGGVKDYYPNEDIRDAIEQLIHNEILFIGINFTNKTEIMFKEIFKIYEQHKKQELFLQSNMIGMAHSNVGAELVKLIQQASEQSTKTNERGSFSNRKNDQNKRPSTKDGAMEALCKQPNLFNFDKEPNVQVITTRFTVHQVDMKERAFTTNIQTIRNIRVPDDYVVTNEGKWDCIRTTKPFAFGMMKEVYLMKKQNDRESHLYVIKMPLGGKLYPSINEAIKECRSHLISKSLMRKFNRDLQDAIEKKRIEKRYPQIQYSDFLILEEGPNQFWIAERFFKGEFVKYNNNYGFIDDQGTEVNKLAQAFSYYTYWVSNFNYIINDVQGVGLYFTDPAIITADGDYDETDMGVDGQGMYMTTFDSKKHICKEILNILDIEI